MGSLNISFQRAFKSHVLTFFEGGLQRLGTYVEKVTPEVETLVHEAVTIDDAERLNTALTLFCEMLMEVSSPRNSIFTDLDSARRALSRAASTILVEQLGFSPIRPDALPFFESSFYGWLTKADDQDRDPDVDRAQGVELINQAFISPLQKAEAVPNPQRLAIRVAIGEFSDTDEVAEELAKLFRALSEAHIFGGGQGLIADDWQLFVEQPVPVTGGVQ